ncbi:Vps62-related protein (plasmid) [Kitasatospora sp. NBC_00070]|uniref:Vps62-related protein n=1 Tax=Kitasatospora sp. NBC_00070 TaxID=2975962 RepID=UPI002F9100E5
MSAATEQHRGRIGAAFTSTLTAMTAGLVLVSGPLLPQQASAAESLPRIDTVSTGAFTQAWSTPQVFGAPLGVWRPQRPRYYENAPFHPLGDIVMTATADAPKATFLVRDNPGFVDPPADFAMVWNAVGLQSTGVPPAFIWRPVPKPGFTCLGDVVTTSASKPSADVIRCVRTEYTRPARSTKLASSYGSAMVPSDRWTDILETTADPSDTHGLQTSGFRVYSPLGKGADPSGFRVLGKDYFSNAGIAGSWIPNTGVPKQWSDSERASVGLKVWLASAEENFPSSVDLHLANTHVSNGYRVTNEPLGCASCTNPAFLRGTRPDGTREGTPPMYTEVVHRTRNSSPTNITDVVYWMFYPYNNGKRVCIGVYTPFGCAGGYSTFGNHVGDWEHVTVRYVDDQPYQVTLSQHEGDQTFLYGSKYLELDLFRPVVYAATGSHALYSASGNFTYKKLPNGDSLVDRTSRGTAWEWASYPANQFIWQSAGTYAGSWSWLNYTGRWGNPESTCVGSPVNQCVLENGPEGPNMKGEFQPAIS